MNRFLRADIFSHIGTAYAGEFPDQVHLVHNPEAALHHFLGNDWGDARLEARNLYCERIASRSRLRFREWNTCVEAAQEAFTDAIYQKFYDVKKLHPWVEPAIMQICREWIMTAMECEFADICPPDFFLSQASWYWAGRFPCGWIGNFPKGKLVLY